MRSFWHFALILITILGCSKERLEQSQKGMPPGSPTQSVSAAEAYNLGVKLRSEDKIGAISEFSAAIDQDPEFELAIFNRALTHAEVGKDAEALADLARLKDLKSSQADTLEHLLEAVPAIHYNAGQKALVEGNYRKAVEKFTAALVYVAEDPIVLESRADAFMNLGETEKAASDRSKAAEARQNGVESIVVEDEVPVQ